jgi:Leucine-rich repeat (LRR) protein
MIPETTVEAAKNSDLEAMKKTGIIVLPVAVNSNYLSANFVSIQKLDEQTIALLKPISKQLVWLKLGYAELSNNSWKTIGECTQLTRLSIEHTNLTDDNIKELAKLNNLQYLNLVGTRVSAKGVQELKGIAKLESIYLGQTGVKSSDYQTLRSVFPKSLIDSGNYHVENLATDTQLLKAPVVKK